MLEDQPRIAASEPYRTGIVENVLVEFCILDVTHGLGQAPTSLALSDRAEVYAAAFGTVFLVEAGPAHACLPCFSRRSDHTASVGCTHQPPAANHKTIGYIMPSV
jgi:hypothetical protein